MLHLTIRRLGVFGTAVLITVLSIIFSVSIRSLISLMVEGGVEWGFDILVSVLVPLIIAPIMAYIFVSLFVRVDETEQENAKLVGELQEALATAKTLSGLLPICSSCKKVRDDGGYWHQVESYVSARTDADFSHGTCPDCNANLRAEIAAMKKKKMLGTLPRV